MNVTQPVAKIMGRIFENLKLIAPIIGLLLWAIFCWILFTKCL